MSRTPQGQRRPRDPNQLGKLIVDISVGEIEDRAPTPAIRSGKRSVIIEDWDGLQAAKEFDRTSCIFGKMPPSDSRAASYIDPQGKS
jgi:hypothetical protein